jgi:hypothetical protein
MYSLICSIQNTNYSCILSYVVYRPKKKRSDINVKEGLFCTGPMGRERGEERVIGM